MPRKKEKLPIQLLILEITKGEFAWMSLDDIFVKIKINKSSDGEISTSYVRYINPYGKVAYYPNNDYKVKITKVGDNPFWGKSYKIEVMDPKVVLDCGLELPNSFENHTTGYKINGLRTPLDAPVIFTTPLEGFQEVTDLIDDGLSSNHSEVKEILEDIIEKMIGNFYELEIFQFADQYEVLKNMRYGNIEDMLFDEKEFTLCRKLVDEQLLLELPNIIDSQIEDLKKTPKEKRRKILGILSESLFYKDNEDKLLDAMLAEEPKEELKET